MVFGFKEEKIVNRLEREEKEKEKIKQIISATVEDEDQIVKSMEEYQRIGKFEENTDH